MPLNYYELLFKGKKPEKMKADSYLWPEDLYTGKPLLPYEISVSGNYKRFAHQENLVIRNDTVCLFGFGRQEGIRQILLLGPPCLNKEEIVRGIGVNLGLLYQVLRRDRDEYITIHYDNFQWPKQPTDQWHHHSTPYDFSSVMQHHGMWETENSLLTLTTNDIRYQGILGRSRGKLSHRDKKTVNELYGCIRSWRVFCGFRSNPCFNEGYVGSDCNCVCRTGTEGAYCEHVLDDDYYGHLLSPCSQHIDKNSTIESPLYIVKIVMPDTWCVWTIKAPKGQLIALDFTFFQLNTTEDCQDSFLEIREKNMSNGTVFCGNSLADEIYVSDENELSVYLDVRNNISQGFHADVVLFDPEILKLGSSPGSRLQLPPVLFILLCISITLLP
ncbi:protein SpAN-like isoform X2 [Macrobrachium nipponense]|uniref:protein SpAN-like isoform X2 n=1 Tax=Macrobrachium nipponense TaxID=159736 RepID=UPI0030C820A4